LRLDERISVLIIIALLIVAITAGCLAQTSPPKDLTRNSWRLVSYNNGSTLIETAPEMVITITLNSDGTLNGNSGCNNYSGNFELEGELISMKNLTMTERNCPYPEYRMEMEQDYLDLLTNTTRYSVDQGELSLSYYDVRKLLIFTQI